MCFFQIKWLLTSGGIDKKIAAGEIISSDAAITILRKAINIHSYYMTVNWDDAITGDDEFHQEWNSLYYGMINLLTESEDALITIADAIEKLNEDASIHQWYIDNPQYAVGIRGNIKHHRKWRDRWLAIARLFGTMVI